MPPGAAGIQIGLPAWIIYAGGFLLWLLFMTQVACVDNGRFKNLFKDMAKDFWTGCCLTSMRGGTLLLLEIGFAWGDFVSDLAVALSQRFPHIALFILMWVFIGTQILPFLFLATWVHPPRGMMVQPPEFMLAPSHGLGCGVFGLAASCTTSAYSSATQCVSDTVRSCWPSADSSTTKSCGLVLCQILTGFWMFLAAVPLGLVSLVLFIAAWIVTLVCAVLECALWLLTWFVFLLFLIVVRLLLFGLGFLLYTTKVISFPDMPVTQFFYNHWSGPQAVGVRTRELEYPSTLEGDSILDLTYQKVHIFTLHFSYITELLFETIAQFVIQIVVAAYSGWTWITTGSVCFSSALILMYTSRYFYWFVIKPCCIDGKPFRQQLIECHMRYYGFEMDDEDLDALGMVASRGEFGDNERDSFLNHGAE